MPINRNIYPNVVKLVPFYSSFDFYYNGEVLVFIDSGTGLNFACGRDM